MKKWFTVTGLMLVVLALVTAANSLSSLRADTPVVTPPVKNAPAIKKVDQEKTETKKGAEAKGGGSNLRPLDKKRTVLIDVKRKLVIVKGKVVLRKGQLEMFVCPEGTKEHESVISVPGKAYLIHTALVAVGAVPGKPVHFAPKYVCASGPIVDVFVLWKDKEGKLHKDRAQDWVRDAKTGKAMSHDWVFGGSSFWTDDEGVRHYQAEGGELICLSNFSTAMMDLPIKSGQANDDLLFSCFTKNIPPVGTEVQLVLMPRLAGKKKP